MRMLAGTFALALLALTPFNVSTASPLAPVPSSNVAAVMCDEAGALACKATCPFDTVENYEACAYACEVFHGCA